MDSGVINFDDLPDDNPLPKQAAPQALGAINFDDLPDDAAPALPPLPSAGFGTFGTSVGKSYNEFNVQKGLADRVRIEGMLQELNAGGNPDINPVKTWGAGIKFDIGRALGANVDAPEVKRQYLLNRLGEIDKEIKSSGAAVQAAGPGSQQLSDLQAGLQEAQKKDSFLSKTGAAFSALKENPRGIPEMIGGGAYTMGRPIAAGIGAAAVSQGSSLIPMAASALVSGADSYDGTMAEIIEQKGREGGIDVRKNPEVIPTLLQDAGFIEAAKGEALRRGISDAAWSAISMRLGMSPKIKGVWQPVVQSAAEGGTEITGQIARKGEVYDPTAVPVALTAGFAFEGPSYALGRAAGAFGKATPPPAAPGPQAQQAPAPTPVAPQPINADDLPSVAGETVEAPAAPAPVATAPVQPELPVQPAAQPQAVAPAPAPVAPAQPVAAVQPVAQPATTPVATENVEPFLPKYPGNEAPLAEKLAWSKEYEAWKAKHGKTHFVDGTPRPADYIEGTPEFAARVAKGNADKATATQAQQPAPAPVAVQPQPTPAPAPQPVATAQPEAEGQKPKKQLPEPSGDEAKRVYAEQMASDEIDTVRIDGKRPIVSELSLEDAQMLLDRDLKKLMAFIGTNQEGSPGYASYLANVRKLKRRIDALKSGQASAQPEAKPVAPVAPAAQAEIPGTAETFNLTGEQVATPAPKAVDTTAEMPLPETRENPLATEARARLAKLEAAGKGDSDQAKALRRTIERESQPAAQAEAPAPTAEAPNVDLAQDKDVSTETKAALAKADAEVMAAFKKYGKKSQQYKDAQKAKKKIFEKALAEKSKALEAERDAQPTPTPVAEVSPPQSPQAEVAPVAEAAPVEQPKQEAKPAKPREKKPDATTGEPYQVALARRRVDNPKTNRSRYIEAVRVLDQYENDQKLANYDKTADLDKSSDEGITDFLDAHSKRPEYEVTKAESDYAESVSEYAAERFGSETGQRGDLLADMRDLAKKGVALPVLPKWMKVESGRTFADILAGKMPGVLAYPPLLKADMKRARTDGEFRKDIKAQFDGMVEKYAQALADLGWTQVDIEKAGFDELVDLVSRASDGEKLVPQGGVQSFRSAKEGNPRAYSTGPNANVNPDANQQADEEMDTREPEPTEQQKQFMVDLEAEYGDPRFDAEPTPAEQAILDAASDNMPTEESILDALDKAAAERLDPKNRSSIGPDLIAAVMWQTARDIQKGVVTFAKWAADTVRNFPSLKGSLKTIWAKAQDIAKRPIDYIRFRALDTIADKVWQNVRRNKGSATLRKIANIVFAKGGPDADAVDNDIPTRVNLVRTQFSNIYASIMERFAADFADMTPEQRRQWDADFRKYVIDGTTPSDPKLAKAVKDFRNLMRDLLAYQREAGIEMGDQGVNYFPRNYDPDAVEANRPGFVKAAIEMYRRMGERMYAKIMAEPITQEQIDTRAESLKDKDDKAGTTLRSDDEYKRIAEIQLEQTRQERADKYNFSPDDLLQKAEDWATAITHGDVLGLTLFKASEGKITSDATDARKFSNDEAKLADEFLKKNVDDIMLGYIDGAVRGAELARVFGEDGKMFEQMMNKLSNEGVDKETVLETRRLVQKALGVGREQASQATAVFFDWVNVVLAGAFLGKTAIYNLVLEPISFGVRTGNVYLAVKGMVDTWRYAIAEIGTPSAATRQRIEAKYGSRFKFEKAVTETVGEQVGLIQREMERAYFNSHWDYSSGEKGSKLAKWISQRIYRANLMSATEKAKVQASIGIARLALRDNARFLAGTAPIQKLFKALGFDTNAEKSAAVIMRENGVPEADHEAFAAFVEGLEGKTDAEWQAAALDPRNKMAKHYRRALQRMSLGMSIKTNPALKMEMSDSVLGRMLMQLMNYSYAYSNLIKDRMYSMAAETVAKDASKIDRLRYAAPLMVGAPLAVLAAVGSKALISAMWPSDEMEEINKKKAAARKAFDAASFAGMFGPKIEYLVKGFERGQTPGGPVAETVFRGGQAAFAAASDPESAKKIYNAKKQAYSSTVKPLVTGGAAAVHPFFGFLGNVAVNKQEVREAVIGDKPKK